jgi:hypothetical protein
MSKNPYQLKRIPNGNGAPSDKLYKPLSEEEQRKKLEGYIRISKEGWKYIPYNSHIRYIETAEKGGKFRSGGFVGSNSIVSEEHGRRIKLKNSLFKNGNAYREWIVNYSDIEHIYCKISGNEFTIQQDMKTITTTLLAEIKALNNRISKLENR